MLSIDIIKSYLFKNMLLRRISNIIFFVKEYVINNMIIIKDR